LPGAARRLAEFLGEVVAYVTAQDSDGGIEQKVRCRRRRGRYPCEGKVEVDFEPDIETIVWWCTVCGENGHIRNWEGTLWDTESDTTPH
jgi:hypothetical protein